mmetsp:Transcript_20924/g.52392  ORF Transcript_20924/g.52392 Transcript_20924/m.52392 type:complete len:886 (-) Transcript_20924:261-2918(-)
MSIAAVATEEDDVCVRSQTPDGDHTFVSQKRSPGASRPASLTPIGSPAPERQNEQDHSHANTWSLCDLFSGEGRPNSAPLEQRQMSVASPPPAQDHSPPRGLAGLATQVGPGTPELPTFHPQPRRLHQPFVTPLLESEAVTPPLSPTDAAVMAVDKDSRSDHRQRSLIAAQQPSGSGVTAGDAGGTPPGQETTRAATTREDAPDHRGEPFASTPSPDRDNFGSACGDSVESPNPVVAHRSMQNTPEPSHHYYNSIAAGLVDRMGLPISTPSPGVTSGGSWSVAPRFPPAPGGCFLPQLCSDFPATAASALPPPLPTPQLGADTVGALSVQAVAFATSFRVPLSGANAGVFTQVSKQHLHGNASNYAPSNLQNQAGGQGQGHFQNPVHMQAHLQGLVHGIQAANPQDAHHHHHYHHHHHHHLAQSYQSYQQAAALASIGSSAWRVPGCSPPSSVPVVGCPPSPATMAATVAATVTCPEESIATLLSCGVAAHGGGGGGQPGAGVAAGNSAQTTSSRRYAITGVDESSVTTNATHDPDCCQPLPPEVAEMRGQVVQLSKTQAGSKFLQRQLLKGHVGVVGVILGEVEQEIANLMCDAYGNYLCSVAFQACSVRQRTRMLEKLAPQVAAIACDKRGTHALQALIGLLSTIEEQESLMRAIKNDVVDLCMDPNGTHVVQRLLLCFVPPCTDWIYRPVVDSLVEIAHHPYGLCVLKKCISQAKAPGHHHDMLLAQLANNALDLVQSPYGNYAVQHALDEWGGSRCTPIFKTLQGRMMQLSIQKFSSNVVEKLFCAATPEFRMLFISELIESEKMSVLVNSNYGHYVVKRALQLAELPQVRMLLEAIHGNIGQLPNRRLRAKWEKVMMAGHDRLGDQVSVVSTLVGLQTAG